MNLSNLFSNQNNKINELKLVSQIKLTIIYLFPLFLMIKRSLIRLLNTDDLFTLLRLNNLILKGVFYNQKNFSAFPLLPI